MSERFPSTPEERTLALEVGLGVERATATLNNARYLMEKGQTPGTVSSAGAVKVAEIRANLDELFELCASLNGHLAQIETQEGDRQ